MKIHIERIDDAFKMKATNQDGKVTFVDGSKSIGASEDAFRPMQLLLTSLAACSAIDILNILKKQRQDVQSFEISAEGQRVDGIPSPFKRIDITFIVAGNVKEKKLVKAVELTQGKYCSVYFSLHPEIEINYHHQLKSAGEE